MVMAASLLQKKTNIPSIGGEIIAPDRGLLEFMTSECQLGAAEVGRLLPWREALNRVLLVSGEQIDETIG